MFLESMSTLRNDSEKYKEKWSELSFNEDFTNSFCETTERTLRSKLPLPSTYDVHSPGHQPFFTEYRYTDAFSGIFCAPFSTEIAARIASESAERNTSRGSFDACTYIQNTLDDKYVLSPDNQTPEFERVIFLAGSNLDRLHNYDKIARLMFEYDDIALKPHPLTNQKHLAWLRRTFGADRLLPSQMSGVGLLKRCSYAYVTTASTLAIQAVVLDKSIRNISLFRSESIGSFYPLLRCLFKASNDNASTSEVQHIINNVIGSRSSGWFLPGMDDLEGRISEFVSRSMMLRAAYKPIASPVFE